MTWEAWAVIGIIAAIVFSLLRNLAGPDTVLMGALALLMTLGVFSDGKLPQPAEAVAGFANEGLVTIAVLFVVAAGLTHTGAMTWLTRPLLGQPRTVGESQVRLMFPVALLSAFLNNTPIVAIFMPVVRDWCRKTGLAPSKLFIPLSYAAIMGGTCTLIGTSTNLVVLGLVRSSQAQHQMMDVNLGMFTITVVGVPATLVGMGYILLVAGKLLPDRRQPAAALADSRRYTFEMIVEPRSSIDGRTIEKAGLRHLEGVYLVEIERDGERLVAVGPEQVLHGNDRLIFAGVVDSVVDLRKMRGLKPATDQVFKLADPRPNRCLVEAVVSDGCPLLGQSIRAGRFRTVYDGAVLAVHRGGEHLANQKIGDIVLQPGDTLLVETHPRFVEHQRNRPDFFLVSEVSGSTPLRHDRAWISLAALAAMVLLVTLEVMTLLNAALLAAGVMIFSRCLTPHEARNSLDLRVLLAIGAAIGVGRSLELSGGDRILSDALLQLVEPLGPYGLLAGIYLLAMLFNMMIGNIGSAVLVFPIAKSAVASGGEPLHFMPFVIAIMMAASASYATPISYPTNLMVYGAGSYRYSDYLKIGLPLNFIVMAVTVVLAPMIWPFY